MSLLPMGLPGVTVQFQGRVNAFNTPAGAGVLALLMKNTGVLAAKVATVNSYTEALDVAAWTDPNKTALQHAFDGGPAAVVIVVLPEAGDWDDGYELLESQRFDICTVAGLAPEDDAEFVAWAKAAYDTKGIKALFVTGSAVAPDHPALIHFEADNVSLVGPTGTPVAVVDPEHELLPLIAGIFAGLQLWESATFYPVNQIADCARLTKAQADAAIAAGKVILYHDGEKIKIARGVTSLTTTTATHSAEWQKAKVVRILNQLETDITRALEDNYIGKVPNTAQQKVLLVSAVLGYLQGLEANSVLQADTSEVEIDVGRTRAYLKTRMEASEVDALSDEEIIEVPSDDKVFLLATVRPADAIEDITVTVML